MELLLVALVSGLGCQAKDYKEKIGPYEVNFTLPDDVASTIEVNKTITSSETLGGTPYYRYSINLQIPETDRVWGSLWITHHNAEMDLAVSAEDLEGYCRGAGYNLVRSAHRIIATDMSSMGR